MAYSDNEASHMTEELSPIQVMPIPFYPSSNCHYAERFIRLDIRWRWKPIRTT